MKLSERVDKIEQAIDNLTAIIFDMKDNHLKCIDDKVTRLDERTKLILTLVSLMLGTVVIGGSVAVIIRMCF